MSDIYKKLVLAFVSVFSLVVFSTQSFAAPVDDASKFVETVGNSAVATLTNKSLSKEKKQDKIEKLFRDNVDTAWIGKFVLGRFWKQATDDQKKRYLKEYEAFITNRYATRFSDYSSGSFKILGAHDDGNGEFTINMQIESGEAGSKPVMVDYRVRKGSKFAIFDIIVEGVSMITTQRSEFTSVINSNGMDYLITQLANKTIVAGTEKN